MKGQNYALVQGRVVWRQDRVICRLSDGKKKRKRKRKRRQIRSRQIEKTFSSGASKNIMRQEPLPSEDIDQFHSRLNNGGRMFRLRIQRGQLFKILATGQD